MVCKFSKKSRNVCHSCFTDRTTRSQYQHLYKYFLHGEFVTCKALSGFQRLYAAWRPCLSVYKILPIGYLLSNNHTAGGLWTGIGVAIARAYAKTPERYPPVFLWLISAAVADILIAGSLSWSLVICLDFLT